MSELQQAIEMFKPCTYPGVIPERYLIGDSGSVYDTMCNEFKPLYEQKDREYLRVGLYFQDGSRKIIHDHRLVAYEFVPGYDETTGRNQVDHINNIGSDNYYKNLQWLTVTENNQKRYNNPENTNWKNPPKHIGITHPSCKEEDLTIVVKICELLQSGLNTIEVFYQFGYKAQSENKKFYCMIYDIKRRRRWESISKNYNF